MNKKAFTLVEMLAVIAILAIVSLLVFPSIASLIKRSKQKTYEQQILYIMNTADMWIADNIINYSEEKDGIDCILIDDLKSNGYLSDKDIIDPRDNKKISGYIKVFYNKYKIINKEYVVSCTPQ